MGYNVTAATIMLFFIACNVTLFWISASQVLPVDFRNSENPDSPVTDPNNIVSLFIGVDASSGNLILGGVGLGVAVIVGWAAGNFVAGGALGVGIFAFTIFSPIIRWILFGIPHFLDLMGAPAYISGGLMALLAVPLGMFVLSLIAQRPIEGHG